MGHLKYCGHLENCFSVSTFSTSLSLNWIWKAEQFWYWKRIISWLLKCSRFLKLKNIWTDFKCQTCILKNIYQNISIFRLSTDFLRNKNIPWYNYSCIRLTKKSKGIAVANQVSFLCKKRLSSVNLDAFQAHFDNLR